MNNKHARRKAAIINVAPSGILPAAELIANNVDLLMEILLRLPAESTIRFKSVSKHWLSLLSDSGFAPNHCSQNPRPSISGLYFYFAGTISSVSLQGGRHDLPSLSFLKSRIGAIHSCNGLLLCYVSTTINGDFRGYIVCNPSTKKHTLLPKPIGLVGGWDAYLAFDPTKSPHQYKVVSLRYNTQEIDVYSSQSLRWKKIIPDQKYDGVCTFWNGVIHWLTDDHFLKRFDVDGEEMIAMPNPRLPIIFSSDKTLYFGECGDNLILIQSLSWCPNGFRILELKRDCSGWAVKCWVNLRPLISVFPEMEWKSYNHDFDGYAVLGAVKGDNERGFAILLTTPRRIISYNPMYKRWNVLRDLVPRESYEFGMKIYAFPFMATLFPV